MRYVESLEETLHRFLILVVGIIVIGGGYALLCWIGWQILRGFS